MTIQVIPVDEKYLSEHQMVLGQVCDLYCAIWEQDSHFGEYKLCPQCRRYYSFSQVESGITRCSICNLGLVNAWDALLVKETLMQTSQHYSFSGALLIDDSEQVFGFSWGRLFSSDEMNKRWGDAYQSLVVQNPQSLYCFYLEELAILPTMRGNRFGMRLLKEVLFHPFGRYPHVAGALSTHQDSNSVYLYKKLGYVKVADKPSGQGRIRMGIPSISNLHLFN